MRANRAILVVQFACAGDLLILIYERRLDVSVWLRPSEIETHLYKGPNAFNVWR